MDVLHPVLIRWLQRKEHNDGCRPGTIYHYGRDLQNLANWIAEQTPGADLLDATPEQLELYTGMVLHERKLRPPTRKRVVAAVRGFFVWATRMNLIAVNPAHDLPTPRCATRMPRAAQLGDIEKILMQPDLSTFQGVRDAAMLFVLIGTGCRVSGLTALNERSLIWTTDALGRERLIIRFREKGKKERDVPVPVETALMIRAYLGHAALNDINRVLPDGDQVLFCNLKNTRVKACDHYGEHRRLNRTNVHDMIRRYGTQAGIRSAVCHAHALRHLYGAELAEEDVDLLKRMALLGHAKPETTEIYSHLAMRKLFAVIDQANPLAKVKTPVTALANKFRAETPIKR